MGKKKKNVNEASSFYGVEFVCDSLGRWNADIEAVVAGCDSCGFVTDERDGHVYRTIKMAGLKWTSENLKFLDDDIVVGAAGAPKCYRGDCETYGYYYKVIGDLCPDGWRLPTSEEYNRLLEATSADGYKELFSKTGWNGMSGSSQDSVRFATSTVAVSCERSRDCKNAGYFVLDLSRNVDSIKVKAVSGISELYVRCVESASAEQKKYPDNVGVYKDERDGTVYNTVTFGDQVWIVQNMNYVTNGSVCMDDPSESDVPTGYRLPDYVNRSFRVYEKKESCRMGQLYTESVSHSVCPDGWRLPTREDVLKLRYKVNGIDGEDMLFDYWIPNQNEVYNKYAMVTEYDYAKFWILSNVSRFWSSEEDRTWKRSISFDDGNHEINPVRCMKDLHPSNKKSSSSMAPVSSSSAPESSSSDNSTMECNAENEGKVKTEWNRVYHNMGYERYFRCESGAWVEKDVRVTCDTAGVAVGAVCIKMDRSTYPFKRVFFIYEGNGMWRDYKELEISKECTDANEGSFEVVNYGNETGRIVALFTCHDGGWVGDLGADDYKKYFCALKNDTCSFYYYDEKKYYRYFVYDEEGNGEMRECSYDPEIGYCPIDGGSLKDVYREVGGKNYYCSDGKWREVSFIPRQLTDPRKDGLTDEEYDVLDLPQNATVGDIVGGLMENCKDNYRFAVEIFGFVVGVDESYPAYDYCVSRNYYQYQENGSWNLMTNEDMDSIVDANVYNSLCRSEIEGKEILTFASKSGRSDEFPSATYKCVSGDWELVEYHFTRYKIK